MSRVRIPLVAVMVAALVQGCAAPRPGITEKAASREAPTLHASDFCGRTHELNAAQQDRLLRFAAVVQEELAAVGDDAVLVSRSGLDLSRFQIRYSHAAVASKGAGGRWMARQLYYACDEGRPRLYDQGMAGFVMGIDNPSLGYVSIVRMPPEAAGALQSAVHDHDRALRLLAANYSANAYAYGLGYQNCNQWVMEMLATAWGGLRDNPALREHAQAWLLAAGYAPQPVQVGSQWLMAASAFVPLLHLSDHPAQDRAAMALRISLPATIEAFVLARYPTSERIEICQNDGRVVVRRGWEPVAHGCRPRSGDRVIALDL